MRPCYNQSHSTRLSIRQMDSVWESSSLIIPASYLWDSCCLQRSLRKGHHPDTSQSNLGAKCWCWTLGHVGLLPLVGMWLQSAQIQQGADNYSHVFLHRRICTSLTHRFILGLGSLWKQTCCLLLRPHKGLHVACVALEDQCRAARLESSLCGCWWKLLRLMLQLLQAFVRVAQSSTPMTLSDWATVCTDSELRIFFK